MATPRSLTTLCLSFALFFYQSLAQVPLTCPADETLILEPVYFSSAFSSPTVLVLYEQVTVSVTVVPTTVITTFLAQPYSSSYTKYVDILRLLPALLTSKKWSFIVTTPCVQRHWNGAYLAHCSLWHDSQHRINDSREESATIRDACANDFNQCNLDSIDIRSPSFHSSDQQ